MLLGSFFETFALGQLVRKFLNKGLNANLYYFRDNHGLEVNFIIPEGKRIHIYECKWKHQSARLPGNIVKFQKTVGENTAKSVNILTGGSEKFKITSDTFVTNLVEF